MSTQVHGFYGFKGGAGRSMILAHLASMLAAKGHSVLMIDFDLEAPGLGDFFDRMNKGKSVGWRSKRGMVDLLNELFTASKQRELLAEGDKSVAGRMRQMLGTRGKRTASDLSSIEVIRNTGNDMNNAHGGSVDSRQLKGKNLWLLGPGDHRAEQGLKSDRYLDGLLQFDWFRVLRSGGEEMLAEMGKYLREGDHGFDHILIDAQFSALCAVTQLPSPASAMTWDWADTDPFEVTSRDRIHAASIASAITLAQAIATSTAQIEKWRVTLLGKLLDHQMARFAHVNRSDGTKSLVTREAQRWNTTIEELQGAIPQNSNLELYLRGAQRLSRIAAQPAIGLSLDDRNRSAVTCLNAMNKLGGPIRIQTLDELGENTAWFDASGPSWHEGGSIGRAIWEAGAYIATGHYLRAATICRPIFETLLQEGAVRPADSSSMGSFLGTALRAEAMLDCLQTSEQLFAFALDFFQLQDSDLADPSPVIESMASDVLRTIFSAPSPDAAKIEYYLNIIKNLSTDTDDTYAYVTVMHALAGTADLPGDVSFLLENLDKDTAPRLTLGAQNAAILAPDQWTGGGVFTGERVNYQLASFIGFSHGRLIEALVRADRHNDVRHILELWSVWIAADEACALGKTEPIVLHCHAIYYAFDAHLNETDNGAQATALFKLDVAEKGDTRRGAYRKPFELCGLNISDT